MDYNSRMPKENWETLERILVSFLGSLFDARAGNVFQLMLEFAKAYVIDRDAEYELVFDLVKRVLDEY